MAERWANWAGDQVCAPERIERPRTEDEVAAAVARAAAEGRRVRVSASGHSFTDIACTDDVMLRLDALDRVLSADLASGLVQVQAGVTLNQLGAELAERGLAMENQGDIDRQQLAGAISTATHGTGARFPNLSAQVAGLRLVTADGSVRELGEDSPELRAARVGLGALGVVTAVTLRCVPLFTLRRVDRPAGLADTLDRLDELVDSNDHFEFYGFPHTDRVITRASERSEREPEPTEPWKRWVNDVLVENAIAGGVFRLGRAVPAAVPAINRALVPLMQPSVTTDRAYRVYASRRNIPFTEMEYGIPREAAAEAVRRVVDLIERRGLAVGMPYEVRFTRGDDAHLSTAAGRDTCYVAVHQYRGMDFDGYFRAVERVMDDYGGRPHWGKRHNQTAATLEPRYPGWADFQAVRRELDPDGVFANDYTDRVLGPTTGR